MRRRVSSGDQNDRRGRLRALHRRTGGSPPPQGAPPPPSGGLSCMSRGVHSCQACDCRRAIAARTPPRAWQLLTLQTRRRSKHLLSFSGTRLLLFPRCKSSRGSWAGVKTGRRPCGDGTRGRANGVPSICSVVRLCPPRHCFELPRPQTILNTGSFHSKGVTSNHAVQSINNLFYSLISTFDCNGKVRNGSETDTDASTPQHTYFLALSYL